MRTLFVFAMSMVGGVIGIITYFLITAFIPACGEDCSSERLASLVICLVGGIAVFSITSIVVSRRSIPSLKKRLLVCIVLSSLFLVPGVWKYIYELHSEYLELKAIAPIQPTTDFYHMAITTRNVQSFTDASHETAKPLTKIPQWERCLIGAPRCESSPKQVEILCKAGVVFINEPDWSAFALIPQENSRGVVPLKSMQFCNEK